MVLTLREWWCGMGSCHTEGVISSTHLSFVSETVYVTQATTTTSHDRLTITISLFVDTVVRFTGHWRRCFVALSHFCQRQSAHSLVVRLARGGMRPSRVRHACIFLGYGLIGFLCVSIRVTSTHSRCVRTCLALGVKFTVVLLVLFVLIALR